MAEHKKPDKYVVIFEIENSGYMDIVGVYDNVMVFGSINKEDESVRSYATVLFLWQEVDNA